PSDANPADLLSFNNRFGSAVALRGDLLFVGATSGKVNNLTTGKVFVHQRDAGGAGQWGEVAVLSASDGTNFEFFGRALYAAANGLFVASSKGINGTVYFFRNPGSVSAAAAPSNPQAWTQVYSFSTTENIAGSRFGEAMAGSGNTLVIGAVGYNGAQGGVFS